ncbi:MAG TPA: glycoside hydrolase family 15 protein [Gaiellaceae bacterium]|nr:glycoside hydrolase family 15 protein [Gaiellaceae bacterium]
MRIEDYGLIGDLQTAALVGLDGSIDWLCFPRFDSGACFAALLGDESNGRWLLAPDCPVERVERRYRERSLVHELDFHTEHGSVRVTDFMPPRGTDPDIVRIVEGLEGSVPMRMELVLRFDYGSIVPWVHRLEDDTRIAVAGPDAIAFRTPVPLRGENLSTVAEFASEPGERVPFVLTWFESHRDPPRAITPEHAYDDTCSFWNEWLHSCSYGGRYSEAVFRSLMVLKAMTYAPTGGIVAAPTTSLPEQMGGVRNWDYRFCWLRDASFALAALIGNGFVDEAGAWRKWLLRAVAGDPDDLQIMYGPAGERRLTELELDWLDGYEGSKPVRIGNGASTQFQLDVYGEVLDVLYQARLRGLAADDTAWALVRHLLENLEARWREPDEGIWEVRGPRRHFTHSKVMAWVAFDRGLRLIEELGRSGPAEHWHHVRDEIKAEVLEQGFDRELGSFVQSYGSKRLDASLLTIPLYGFLPPDDPRVRGTLEAVRRELLVDGFVQRYRHDEEVESVDGLPPGEGAFFLCSFWFVDNLILLGELDEAFEMFERLLSLRNDLGLLSEEYNPTLKRFVGNFPQAFSHIGLVNTALRLDGALAQNDAKSPTIAP